jgi:hypothetical protein
VPQIGIVGASRLRPSHTTVLSDNAKKLLKDFQDGSYGRSPVAVDRLDIDGANGLAGGAENGKPRPAGDQRHTYRRRRVRIAGNPHPLVRNRVERPTSLARGFPAILTAIPGY